MRNHNTARSELTAFVREVVLPGGWVNHPRLQPHHCRFKLECRKSPIHRWGIFAAEPIPARRRILEYTGRKIDTCEAWRRSIRPQIYLFWLDDDWAIDGAIGGSGAEFINHCCDPNVMARIVRCRIFVVSRRPIAQGEELTLDYKLEGQGEAVACTCGSKLCRGFV